jgi:hypothetical protein
MEIFRVANIGVGNHASSLVQGGRIAETPAVNALPAWP